MGKALEPFVIFVLFLSFFLFLATTVAIHNLDHAHDHFGMEASCLDFSHTWFSIDNLPLGGQSIDHDHG